MKKSQRIFALLLCLVMCVSLLPVSAVADEEGVDFAQAEVSEEPAAEDSAAQEETPDEEPAAVEETPAEETPAEESAPA